MRTLILLIAIALTAGCASTPDANYNSYLQAHAAAEQREALARDSIADAADCNGDATCVVAAKGFAALALAAAGQGSEISQYVRQPSAAERFGLAFVGALAPLANAYVALDAGRNNVDIARIGAEREIAVTQAWSDTTTGVAEAFGLLPPSTSITVGRDYITGTQHVGDAIGGDYITGHIGDSVGRDQIDGDQHVGDYTGRDDNSENSGRIYSDGPFEENGDDCTGERCQGDGDVGPPGEPDQDPEG